MKRSLKFITVFFIATAISLATAAWAADRSDDRSYIRTRGVCVLDFDVQLPIVQRLLRCQALPSLSIYALQIPRQKALIQGDYRHGTVMPYLPKTKIGIDIDYYFRPLHP